MMQLIRDIALLLAAIFLFSGQALINPAAASPNQRGFVIPLESVSAESLTDIKNRWGANILRIQIGNNVRMDGPSGADYDAMMEERFTLLDQKLPLILENGLQMIFCLQSPPGGFLTREAPSHYRMYSEPALQDEYIAKWREIVARYGSHPAIYAFDIDNEPAMRKALVAAGSRTWNKLVVDVIKAIRETHPTLPLIVKPLYGDPSKLVSLPAINDANVIYAYNSYLYNNYQHTGVTSSPFSIQRPSDAAILQNMRRRVGGFFFKHYQSAQRKEIAPTAYPPKLMVGEVAVSACALESGIFLAGLLTALEKNDSVTSQRKRDRAISKWRRARKRNSRAPKPKFTPENFYEDVQHQGYAIHAYGESPFWDPRYECNESGALTPSLSDTDRAIVIKSLLSKNATTQ